MDYVKTKIDMTTVDKLWGIDSGKYEFFKELYKNNIILMFADNPAIRINLDEFEYEILDDKYIPYYLKGLIKQPLKVTDGISKEDLDSIYKNNSSSVFALRRWLARRILTLNRENARWIYNYFNISRNESEQSKLEVAVACRCLSVIDNYWIKIEGEDISWSDVNLRLIDFRKDIADIGLHGNCINPYGSMITPELTTDGTCAKGWRKHNDGTLWLNKLSYFYKPDSSEIEVSVSNILNKCNVNHLLYKAGKDNGKYVCTCPCMSNEKYSIVPAHDFKRYCIDADLDFEKEVLRIDADTYRKMHIIDYLISNIDRHGNNWGFYMDNETMELVSLHPLFDHNNSFDKRLMEDGDMTYRCTGRPLSLEARNAMSKVDFHFTDDIVRSDFVTDKYYESFMKRAKELGIKTIKKC